jgi:hypothetical protein
MHDREAQGKTGRSYTQRGDVAAEIYDSAIAWNTPAGIVLIVEGHLRVWD